VFEHEWAIIGDFGYSCNTGTCRFAGHEQDMSGAIDKSLLTISEPRRYRSKAHLKFVAGQACLVCGREPSDPHHLGFAQPRALGRKVSDEFTVPLCRSHHREVHRSGHERAWWTGYGLDPLMVAQTLWCRTHPLVQADPPTEAIDPEAAQRSNPLVASGARKHKTKPIHPTGAP